MSREGRTPDAWRCSACGNIEAEAPDTSCCPYCQVSATWQECYFTGGLQRADSTVAMMRASTAVRNGEWVAAAPSHVFPEFYLALRAIGWDVVPSGQTPMVDTALAAVSAYIGSHYQRRGELEGAEAKSAVRRAFFELRALQRALIGWRRELTTIAGMIEPGRLASSALRQWMGEYERMWSVLEQISDADSDEDPRAMARAVVEGLPPTHARKPEDIQPIPEIEP